MTSEDIIQIAKETYLGLPLTIQTAEALALREEISQEMQEAPPGTIFELPTEI